MKTYRLKLNNRIFEVDIELLNDQPDMSISASPQAAPAAAAPAQPAAAGGQEVTAPLPGKVLDIKVAQGEQVKEGQIVAVLEAMKLENEIFAPCDGTVSQVVSAKGNNVETGDCLLVLA